MFNLSAPLRRRSGGPSLNPGLPEHTPKKRRTKEPVLSTEGHQFDSDLGSRLEQAVDDRHRQIMSTQAPLKERIEDERAKSSGNQEGNNGSGNEESAKGAGDEESAKGACNDKSAKGAANNESDKGSGHSDIAHDAAPTREKPINNEGVKDHSQESSSASTADKNAKAMTDLMWQEHPSMQAQKSAKSSSLKRALKVLHQNGAIKRMNTYKPLASSVGLQRHHGRERFFLPPCLPKGATTARTLERMRKILTLQNRNCRRKLIALKRPLRLRRNSKYFSRKNCKKGNTHSCPRPPTNSPIRANPPTSPREVTEDEVVQVD